MGGHNFDDFLDPVVEEEPRIELEAAIAFLVGEENAGQNNDNLYQNLENIKSY